MGNHTVDNEKKGFIESPATKRDAVTTASVAWQNNQPQKLDVEVTNGKETHNLPFMIEKGDIVSDSAVEVSIKARRISREEFEEMKGRIEKGPKNQESR